MKLSQRLIFELARETTEASQSLDYQQIVAHNLEEVSRLRQVLRRLKIQPLASAEVLESYAEMKQQLDASSGFSEGLYFEEMEKEQIHDAADQADIPTLVDNLVEQMDATIHSESSSQSEQQPQTEPKPEVQAPSPVDRKRQRQRLFLIELKKQGLTPRINKVHNSRFTETTMPFDQVPHRRGLPAFDLVLAPDYAQVAGLHGIFIASNTVSSIVLPSSPSALETWRVIKRESFSSLPRMAELVSRFAVGM